VTVTHLFTSGILDRPADFRHLFLLFKDEATTATHAVSNTKLFS